jgi:hypothetical protein
MLKVEGAASPICFADEMGIKLFVFSHNILLKNYYLVYFHIVKRSRKKIT